MDVGQIEQAITSRTRAIIPVHLYGQPADMNPILAIAREHGLTVIEDSAQAHGAEYNGKKAGSLGDIACFSFYPAKNLGAFGEGGMITTDNASFTNTVRSLRDWGQQGRHNHVLKGYNFRMDEIQGAMLRVKLRYLEQWNNSRRRIAARYDSLLCGAGVRTPKTAANVTHAHHVYPIRSRARDALQRELLERGIHTGLHYPVPVHLQPAYSDLGYSPGDFPQSELAASEVLSLPLYPELSDESVSLVAAAVRECYDG
jgi:dTDP-4-amino-4,6-dideoxygalactose transaminase